MENKKNNSVLFQARVLDVNDPMMLGRIRAVRIIDYDRDILEAIKDPVFNEKKDIWTSRDPLVFSPLLPYFIYSTPKKDELIHIIYLTKDVRSQNQFYIQGGGFSSPTATSFEYYYGGNKFTPNGDQIKSPVQLKNQDGTYTNKTIHNGVFPEPGDNAILGRGSADLIVKQDEVLLRAGKFTNDNLQNNIIPTANTKRAFLQLSRFPSTKRVLPAKTYYELNEQVVLVKYLIEWVITNPENEKNNFVGSVYLYQLKPDTSTNSKNLTIGSDVNENLKNIVYDLPINGTLDEVIVQINNFIKSCNNTNIVNGITIFPDNKDDTKFPFFYRPTNVTYQKIISGNGTIETKNLSKIYNGVKLNPSIKGGYGLVYTNNDVGTPSIIIERKIPQSRWDAIQSSIVALGADKLFLLSHGSAIPGKGGPINFDNTLYGISSENVADEITPKTSSMVRGEELMDLINLIVRFLLTHTHSYPGLPPVQITQDGTKAQDILSELQNAANKILNKNIRLN